jgi:hypothetical protein
MVKGFFDLLEKYGWSEESPLRRFAKRHRVVVAILFLPTMFAISAFFLLIVPLVTVAGFVLSIARFVKKYTQRGRWKKSLKACLTFVFHIVAFGAFCSVGYYFFTFVLKLMHPTHVGHTIGSFERRGSIFFSIYSGLLIFKIAAMSWMENRDPQELDLEKEYKEREDDILDERKLRFHNMFRSARYQRTELAISSAMPPPVMILILNGLLSASILLSAFCLHEAYFVSAGTWFSGVSQENNFGEWMSFVFSRLVNLIPLDFSALFQISLTPIGPTAPYGTLIVFIIDACIAWLLFSFFYGFYNRARRRITARGTFK